MISCTCDYDTDGWYYHYPKDFSEFDFIRRKRCCSCDRLVNHGETCVEFSRFRSPYSEIEERIRGDEVQLASWYMCEWCGGMFFNFESLGYCHFLGDSMQESLKDYWDLTGFKPK